MVGFDGHAFIDWDDTLAENIQYFNQVAEANSRLIARVTGSDLSAVRHRGDELDLATAQRMGLVRDSLAIAWSDCYREFCANAGLQPQPETTEAIWRACQMPYEVKQAVFPGAADTLAWLFDHHFEVTIWTAGDSDVQRRKVHESGLTPFIHRVVVVPDKTPDLLQAAMEGRDPRKCFVAGNSLRSDIGPALAVGILALHIPTETWDYDRSRIDVQNPNYRRVEWIGQLPALVQECLASDGTESVG